MTVREWVWRVGVAYATAVVVWLALAEWAVPYVLTEVLEGRSNVPFMRTTLAAAVGSASLADVLHRWAWTSRLVLLLLVALAVVHASIRIGRSTST